MMNNKWNKRIRLIFIPSTIALMLLLSQAEMRCIFLFVLIGLGIGIFFCVQSEIKHHINCIERVIGTLVAIIFCLLFARYFYQNWIGFNSSTMQVMITKVFADYTFGLAILSMVMSIAAFPCLAYIFPFAIAWGVRFCKLLRIKKILGSAFGRLSVVDYLKGIVILVTNLFVAVIVGVVLLMGAYSLPIEKIEANVRISADTIAEEGTYPQLYSWCHSQLDNWTDSIMLLEAANETEAPIKEKTMYAYRGVIDGLYPADTLISHYIDGTEYSGTSDYARYWHGYLIILKPLLAIMDYSHIRILNGIVQMLLFFTVCFLMVRRGLKSNIVSYALCYLMLMPAVLAKSLQFSSCYYIFTMGIISLLLLKKDKMRRYSSIVFVNIGIATAYFDFLTYPIATFGMPIIMYIALSKADSLEDKLGGIVKNGFFWCIGYGVMWSFKWIVASVTLNSNMVTDALNAFSTRTSNASSDGLVNYSVFSCELLNYKYFIMTPFILLVIVFVGYTITDYKKKKVSRVEMIAYNTLPYVVIAFAPIVWYIFATNHSSVHYWFTNKACVVTLFAVLCGLVEVKQHADTYEINRNSASGALQKMQTSKDNR